jgi:hypothetical protein
MLLIAMLVPLLLAFGGGSRLGGRPTSIADATLPPRQLLLLCLHTAFFDPGQGGSKVVLDRAGLAAIAGRRALGERIADVRVA